MSCRRAALTVIAQAKRGRAQKPQCLKDTLVQRQMELVWYPTQSRRLLIAVREAQKDLPIAVHGDSLPELRRRGETAEERVRNRPGLVKHKPLGSLGGQAPIKGHRSKPRPGPMPLCVHQ